LLPEPDNACYEHGRRFKLSEIRSANHAVGYVVGNLTYVSSLSMFCVCSYCVNADGTACFTAMHAVSAVFIQAVCDSLQSNFTTVFSMMYVSVYATTTAHSFFKITVDISMQHCTKS